MRRCAASNPAAGSADPVIRSDISFLNAVANSFPRVSRSTEEDVEDGVGAETDIREEVKEISEGGSVQCMASPKIFITDSRRVRIVVRVRSSEMCEGEVVSAGAGADVVSAFGGEAVGSESSVSSAVVASGGIPFGRNFSTSPFSPSDSVSVRPMVSPRRTSTSYANLPPLRRISSVICVSMVDNRVV